MRDLINLDAALESELRRFESLVLKWTRSINLVSSGESMALWERHILDSVQLFHVKQDWPGPYLDLGSGGGFPGIVVAILLRHYEAQTPITLVESDLRKATFLRTAVRELNLNARVLTDRIEALTPQNAKILTARALADLETLLPLAKHHLAGEGIALFPKGTKWQQEIEAARKTWCFDLTVHRSKTHPDGRILEVGRISRV